jgi:hypothetical protein
MRAALKLTDAWIARGNPARAITELEQASASRTILDPLPLTWGLPWLTVRDRLAQLYRQAARIADAEIIESELRQLLVVADNDHPIKRRLSSARISSALH